MATSPRPPSKVGVRIAQILLIAVVTGALLAGMWWGGWLGAILVGAVCAAAGTLLVVRWQELHHRTRLVRLMIVIAGFAVAVSLAARG